MKRKEMIRRKLEKQKNKTEKQREKLQKKTEKQHKEIDKRVGQSSSVFACMILDSDMLFIAFSSLGS